MASKSCCGSLYVVAAILFVSYAWGGESVPACAAFNAADNDGKIQILSQWIGELRRRKTASADDKWTPGEEWNAVSSRLSSIPRDVPQLTEATCQFFKIAGSTKEALSFCHAALQLKGQDLPIHSVLSVLERQKDVPEETTALLVRYAEQAKDPEPVVSYFAQCSTKSANLRNVIVTWACENRGVLRSFALNALQDTEFDRKEAGRIAIALSRDLGQAGCPNVVLDAARSFFDRVDIARFSGCLTREDAAQFLPSIKVADPALTAVLVTLIMVGTDCPPDGFAQSLMKRFGESQSKERLILNCLAFIPPEKKAGAEAEECLNCIGRDYEDFAAPGLIAYYIRNGGDVQKVRRLVADNPGRFSESYWTAFCGFTAKPLFSPAQWDARWREEITRPTVVKYFQFHPNAPETSRLLAQSITDPLVLKRGGLAINLWGMRREVGVLTKVEGLKPWLERTAREPKPLNLAVVAGGLLATCFGEKEPIRKTLDSIGAETDPGSIRWGLPIDVALTVCPETPYLDKAYDSFGQVGAGGVWLRWLLDLRRGKRVGPPPVELVGKCLDHKGGPQGTGWLSGFAGGGELLYPWLACFYDRRIFGDALHYDPESLQEYLGILSRLEIERMAHEKKEK